VCALHRRPEHGAPRAKPRTDWTRCVPHFVRSGHAASVLNSERASSLCALWPSPPRHRPPPTPHRCPRQATSRRCARRPAAQRARPSRFSPPPPPYCCPYPCPYCTLTPSLPTGPGRAARHALRRAPGAWAAAPNGARVPRGGLRAWGCLRGRGVCRACGVQAAPSRPPPPRTKWTRRVPHPVLIGHAASLGRSRGTRRRRDPPTRPTHAPRRARRRAMV